MKITRESNLDRKTANLGSLNSGDCFRFVKSGEDEMVLCKHDFDNHSELKNKVPTVRLSDGRVGWENKNCKVFLVEVEASSKLILKERK